MEDDALIPRGGAAVSLIFRHKAVRDLHWVLASPHLLAEPSYEGAVPILADSLCVECVAASVAWLRSLDAEPKPLVSWLSRQRNVRRLGFYFAALLEFWVRYCPCLAVPSSETLTQQQVHIGLAGGVAGQLKCVFERIRAACDGEHRELVHWESHVKYFAFVPVDDSSLASAAAPGLSHDETGTLPDEVELSECAGSHRRAWHCMLVASAQPVALPVRPLCRHAPCPASLGTLAPSSEKICCSASLRCDANYLSPPRLRFSRSSPTVSVPVAVPLRRGGAAEPKRVCAYAQSL